MSHDGQATENELSHGSASRAVSVAHCGRVIVPMHQKWPKSIFPSVNFIPPLLEKLGPGGGGGALLLWLSAALVHPWDTGDSISAARLRCTRRHGLRVDWSNVSPRIDADNKQHKPGGGDRPIESRPIKWDVKARVDHDNRRHKPGGGQVKITNEKVTWNAVPTVPRARECKSPRPEERAMSRSMSRESEESNGSGPESSRSVSALVPRLGSPRKNSFLGSPRQESNNSSPSPPLAHAAASPMLGEKYAKPPKMAMANLAAMD